MTRAKRSRRPARACPVIIAGLNQLPGAGDKFYVVENQDRAPRDRRRASHPVAPEPARAAEPRVCRQPVEHSQGRRCQDDQPDHQGRRAGLDRNPGGQRHRTNTDEVKVKVVHSGVGAISESDVELAMATKASRPTTAWPSSASTLFPTTPPARWPEQNHIDV